MKRIKQQTRETSRLPLIKHVQKEIVPEHLKVLGEQLADLSAEVKVLIFEHLNYKDLSNLSIVCRSFRNIVIQHFVLNKKRLTVTFETMRTTNEEETFQTASDFGLLLKRSTFSYPVSERIELIRELFEMVRLKDQLRHIYKSDNASFKNLVKSVKFLFAKVIRGWKFKETLKLIEEFELHFDHHKLINTFLTQDYGAIRADEQYLRYFYRKIIFEGLDDNRCRAKWLAYFLDYHTNITSDPNIKMTFKGKLMLLLFSPVFQEPLSGVLYIDWYAYSSQFFIDDCLAYLGLAFKLLNLLNASSERRLDIVQLFRTVTNIGLHWLNENSSTLLHYCGVSSKSFDSPIKLILSHKKKPKLKRTNQNLSNRRTLLSKSLTGYCRERTTCIWFAT